MNTNEVLNKLIAEIERLCAEHSSRYGMDEAAIVLDKLEDFISSLQQEQPEVDLEKEIDDYMYPIQVWEVKEAPFTSLEKCARHFYELGLSARKEE